ncbi:chaperonin 10-like protein [Xylogone sp. PMI_703]|nr:chaperonin 10-like protein [Xylogone sp. PMI_703]
MSDSNPSFTVDIFRGTPEGELTVEKVTRTLGYGEIYIETTHSGLCGTDLHYLGRGAIIGHEGVGIVRQIGPGVSTGVKVGDRVGFGYTHKVCGNCEQCLNGRDQYCSSRLDFYRNGDNMGTISSGVIWSANMVFPIPDGYDSADAAPLLCAGATVFTVLTGPNVQPTDRIGIMGVGGLGHLAIKLAAAMGHEVVVLSSSESKRQEALDYGATEFHVYDPEKPVPPSFKRLNHLLLCGNTASKNFNGLIDLLAVNGTIYPLTVSAEHIPIKLGKLTDLGASIKGSLTGSRRTINELMRFASLHGIKPTVMKFPMTEDGIKEAIDTLRSGKMRYRGVLVRQIRSSM